MLSHLSVSDVQTGLKNAGKYILGDLAKTAGFLRHIEMKVKML